MPQPVVSHPSTVTKPRLRGWLHAAAALASLGALVWLLRSAASTEARVAAWIYGVAAVACYVTSATYHLLGRSERARSVLRRADHSMIYVLIAGTLTPICLLVMSGWFEWTLVATVWLGALVGITLTLAPGARLPRFGIALYLILGWAGVATFPSLARRSEDVALVLSAGLLYTVGALLFGRKRPILRPAWFGYHEFWHCIGVTAGALLFAVNLSLVASRTP